MIKALAGVELPHPKPYQEEVEAMVDAEREVFESWQAAETAAMIAAFGTHRYLDEGGFELTITE